MGLCSAESARAGSPRMSELLSTWQTQVCGMKTHACYFKMGPSTRFGRRGQIFSNPNNPRPSAYFRITSTFLVLHFQLLCHSRPSQQPISLHSKVVILSLQGLSPRAKLSCIFDIQASGKVCDVLVRTLTEVVLAQLYSQPE